MEHDKITGQPEITPAISKKELRRPINHVGKAILFQTFLQFITVIIIQMAFAVSFAVIYALQAQASGSAFDSQKLIGELTKLLTQPLILLISLLASSLIGNTIPYFICAKKTGVLVKPLYNKRNISISYMVKMSIITVAAGSIFTYFQYLIDAVLKLFNLKSTSPDILKFPTDSLLTICLYFFTLCIVAPITEEFIFRGVMLSVFRRYGNRFAIVASALIFGLFHANFGQTPSAIVIGLLFAYITIETQSIIPSTIIHFINNSISVILSGLSAYYPKYENIIGYGFDGILIPIGIILFIFWYKKHKKISDDTEYTSSISGTKLIFSSWSCIISIIIYLIITITTIKPLS